MSLEEKCTECIENLLHFLFQHLPEAYLRRCFILLKQVNSKKI